MGCGAVLRGGAGCTAPVDLRAEKALRFGRLNATLDLDVFNALNDNVTLQANRQSDSTTFGQAREIVAPRVVRLGVRFIF